MPSTYARSRKTPATTVADIMMKPVLTAAPDTTVADARRILMDSWIRHLPILEDELLVGIVSDRDLRAVSDGATPLRAVMRSPVFVLSPATPLKLAVRLLRDRRFGAVPVLDGRRLVGIVSVVDVLRQLNGRV
ncbi:MAG TPA: CBS domain-containing protein [Methylomirabilota bacterium]|nr:CBS domain-containing protein [Methylomirabilota bacterium]